MAKATKEMVNYWKEKTAEWQESRLSRKEFCEKSGLIGCTTDYGFRKLKLEKGGQGFIEITLSTFSL